MFTADQARATSSDRLDALLEEAVRAAGSRRTASIRVYAEDSYVHTIRQELEQRGFHDIYVPSITVKGDVSFSW